MQASNADVVSTKPIDIIFSDEMMTDCQSKGPYFYDLYFANFDTNLKKLKNGILYVDNNGRDNMGSQYTSGLPVIKFSGVKAISEMSHNIRDKEESVSALDIDVIKHGMHILRFANFSGSYYVYDDDGFVDDYEGSGFYYIIKGLPEVNKPKLIAMSKTCEKSLADNMTIEKTAGNNTRVTCDW